MNLAVALAGGLLLIGSLVSETIARGSGHPGLALVLELLMVPGIIVLLLGLAADEAPSSSEWGEHVPPEERKSYELLF